MPAYPVPPWLHGSTPDQTASLYLGGYKTGASIAEAQARLSQAANQASQRFAMQQKQLEAEQEMEQVKAQVKQQQINKDAELERAKSQMLAAYQSQMVDLRKSQLQDQQKKTQMAAQKAAQQFAAQQEIQRRITEDPSSASRAYMELGPQAGGLGIPTAQALRDQDRPKQYGPMTVEDLPGGSKAVYRPGSTGMHIIPPPKSERMTPVQRMQVANIALKAQEMLDAAPPESRTNSITKQALDLITPLLKPDQSATRPQAAEDYPDAPLSPSKREIGTTYKTPKGAHQWTAQGWRKPPSLEQGDEANLAQPASQEEDQTDSGSDSQDDEEE